MFLLLVIGCSVLLARENSKDSLPKTIDSTQAEDWVAALTGLRIGGQWFLAFSSGKVGNQPYSQFAVERGYITIEKVFSQRFSGRITPDISVDRDGDGEGDLEMRLKYCYVQALVPNIGFVKETALQFGLVNRPWLNYEEKINTYRMQGPLFLERSDLLNSGDFGVMLKTLLGGSLAKDELPYPEAAQIGRYGSVAVGAYNGGGYHAIERNQNKTLEACFSWRPLPDSFPALQFAYASMFGKGNTVEAPVWRTQIVHAAWESRSMTATLQLFRGKGDYKGEYIDDSGTSLSNNGWSLFAEWRALDRWSVIGRRDRFVLDRLADSDSTARWIFGLVYRFSKPCRTLLSFEQQKDSTEKQSEIQISFETKF
ncbi:hypothetical protein JW992_11725 [candidate division KSB1 bacterium]|nr:hypothetical protein [candidate division KSB1 bacterium]